MRVIIMLLLSLDTVAAVAQAHPSKSVQAKPAVSQTHRSQESQPSTVYKYTQQMPAFPGNLVTFLSDNLRYPELSPEDSMQRKVIIQFIVRKDGSLTDVKIAQHAAKALEQEVLRVVSIMPRWIPGKNDGVPVDVEFMLPIIADPAE